MSKYDDLKDMGRMAESMGDEFPTGDEAGKEKPAEASDEGGDIMDTVDFVGNDEEIIGRINMDDILGIKSEERSPDPEPEKPEQSGSRKSSADDRISELTEAVRHLRAQNEQLLARALGPAETSDDEPAEELSPQTIEYFKRYGLVTKEELREVREAIEPIRQRAKDEKIAAVIADHVPGFSVDHMPALYKAIDKASEAEKALYGDGMAGAVLLAQSLVGEGSLDTGSRKRGESKLARRHHSEVGGASRRDERGSEEAQIRKLESMSADEIMSILDRLS